MKTPQLILILLAFGLGAGLVAALKPGGGDSKALEEKLAATEKRLAELEARSLSGMPKVAALESRQPQPETAPLSALPSGGGDPDPAVDENSPEAQIAKLLNSPEARNLMKGFAGAMSGQADRWIGREVDKYKDKLALTDAQSASIRKRMVAMVEENTKRFQSDLDDGSRSIEQIMEEQGQFWENNEAEIETMLKEELNPDQFAQFETEQLIERTARVQSRADRELQAIDSKVDLSETQEDQVFSILVREAPEFDESMAIEGVTANLPPAAVAPEVTKEDAIRSVLSPEQTETYNANLETGGFNTRGRGGPFGGGRGFGR